MGPRWKAALTAAALLLAAGATGAHGPEAGGTRAAERLALLRDGEAALAHGDAAAAQKRFEAAGQIAHAADAELGLVRALMQAGDYGSALAFGAHTAGGHRDEPEGGLLYAWLLGLGGQDTAAERLLAAAPAPLASRARTLSAALRHGALPSGMAWRTPPMRLAPYAAGVAPDVPARVVASAVLVGDGQHAAAPLAAVPAHGRLWLRNGLGQTAVATVERRNAASGLVLLRLPVALPAGAPLALREPFPGSPAYWVGYGATPQAEPAWPRLRAGFHGLPPADGNGPGVLSVAVPAATVAGGAVFDAHGRLAGMALKTQGAGVRWTGLAALRALRPEAGAPAPDAAPGPRVTAEVTYEAGLRTALQLIVAGR